MTKFTLGTDSTDHFDFICRDCNRIANINKFYHHKDKLYGFAGFDLECPSCHHKEFRKVYLYKDRLYRAEGPSEEFTLATYGLEGK